MVGKTCATYISCVITFQGIQLKSELRNCHLRKSESSRDHIDNVLVSHLQ